MKIVYFPYTAIQPRKAEQLAALWGPVTLLQPAPDVCRPETRALEKAGWIEMLFPADDHDRSLIDHLNAFEQWAARNAGSDLAALMRQRTPTPFCGDQSLARIVTELRNGGKTTMPAAPEKSPPRDIFQDQLLLAMAQKFDRQQEELASQIETLARKEHQMLALLRGEEAVDREPLGTPWTPPSGPQAALLDLRIKAWARVMRTLPEMEEGFPGGTNGILFLTDNRSVMDQIQDHFPEAQLRLEACPVTAGARCAETFRMLPPWLAQLLTSRSVPASGPVAYATLGLDLVEIPALPIGGFFRRLAGGERQGAGDSIPGHTAESCWVGSLSWPEDAEGDAV